jgi:hypothetical protein
MVDVIVGCISAGALALFMEHVVFRRPSPDELHRRKQAIAEKRRVLERDRQEWGRSLRSRQEWGRSLRSERSGVLATAEIARIDRALLQLADEEGRLR